MLQDVQKMIANNVSLEDACKGCIKETFRRPILAQLLLKHNFLLVPTPLCIDIATDTAGTTQRAGLGRATPYWESSDITFILLLMT